SSRCLNRMIRRIFLAIAASAALLPAAAPAADTQWVKAVEEWRQRADQGLRRDNGWLTLAGRYVMKPGVNTFGTGKDNDIVFPPGLGPERMGTITISPGEVHVKLAPGLAMTKDGQSYTERIMGTEARDRDWVQVGRASF